MASESGPRPCRMPLRDRLRRERMPARKDHKTLPRRSCPKATPPGPDARGRPMWHPGARLNARPAGGSGPGPAPARPRGPSSRLRGAPQPGSARHEDSLRDVTSGTLLVSAVPLDRSRVAPRAVVQLSGVGRTGTASAWRSRSPSAGESSPRARGGAPPPPQASGHGTARSSLQVLLARLVRLRKDQHLDQSLEISIWSEGPPLSLLGLPPLELGDHPRQGDLSSGRVSRSVLVVWVENSWRTRWLSSGWPDGSRACLLVRGVGLGVGRAREIVARDGSRVALAVSGGSTGRPRGPRSRCANSSAASGPAARAPAAPGIGAPDWVSASSTRLFTSRESRCTAQQAEAADPAPRVEDRQDCALAHVLDRGGRSARAFPRR